MLRPKMHLSDFEMHPVLFYPQLFGIEENKYISDYNPCKLYDVVTSDSSLKRLIYFRKGTSQFMTFLGNL